MLRPASLFRPPLSDEQPIRPRDCPARAFCFYTSPKSHSTSPQSEREKTQKEIRPGVVERAALNPSETMQA